MKKTLDFIHKNIFFIIVLTMFFTFFAIYLSKSTANVPFMDYWRYINHLVDKMFTQGITFNDLYNNNGIHRSPLQLFIFLANVKLFHYNVQVEVFLGLVTTTLVSCLLYKELKDNFFDKKTNNLYLYIGIIFNGLVVYSLNQWEIFTTEFIFSFELRLLFYLLSFSLINKILKNKDKYIKYAPELSLLFVFIICALSGAYFAAYVGAIILTLLFDFINEKEKKKYFVYYIELLVGLVVGCVLYMNGLSFSETSTDSSFGALLSLTGIINLIKTFIYMAGSSIMGDTAGLAITFNIGAIVCLIHMFCLILFFIKKVYRKNYLPLMLMLYAIFICGEIYLGRATSFSLEYVLSSRYTCETLWFILSDVWIILFAIKNNKYCLKNGKIIFITLSSVILVGFIVGFSISNYKESKIGPYRKEGYYNMIKTIIKDDEYTDEELIPFQADPDEVRGGIEAIRKYNLSVFYYQ